jgi:hypothetical protein
MHKGIFNLGNIAGKSSIPKASNPLLFNRLEDIRREVAS